MTTIIKAGKAGPVLKRLSTVDLADHLAEADAVIEAARRRSEGIISHANTQAEEIGVQAHERGYREGFEKGLEEGRRTGYEEAFEEAGKRFDQQHADIVTDITRAVDDIDRVKKNLALQAEKDLLDFALHLASKLTFAIGRLHRQSAQENFRRALRLVGAQTDLTAMVHPQDVESLKIFAPSVLEKMSASHALGVVEDASMSPGGCVVRTERTRVDARLETQLEELTSLLLGDTKDAESAREANDD